MKNIFFPLAVALLMAFQTQAQLQVSVSVTSSASCFGSTDGSVTAFASGGTAPYQFLWNDPQAQWTQTASGLAAGEWCVIVVDAASDTATACGTVGQPTQVTISSTVTDPSCNGGADGEIVAWASGGVPPYTYLWSNGMNGPAASGLTSGPYFLSVMDANGCGATESFVLSDNGVGASISFLTSNPCDGPLQLEANGSGGSGSYTYVWSTGETSQTVSVTGESMITVAVTNDSGCTATATAYLPTVNGEVDSYFSGWLNRGFCRWTFPVVQNNGCQTFTGPVSVTLDSGLDIDSINPTPDIVVGNILTWNNITLAPAEQFLPHIKACVPLWMSCGNTLDIQIDAGGNSITHIVPILCSYDPNDKQVSPIGIGPEGYIVGTEELTYMVRFQNTGTAPATFIHVRDELDVDLDIMSLRVLTTSHPMELSIDGRELDFFFDNINLPDSASDPAGSQGFLIYAIDMLPGLSQGTEIENTAYIYFDFNEPVITNTTLNTISSLVGIEATEETDGFTLYPNPTTDVMTVSSENGHGFTADLFNAMGQSVLSERCTNGILRMDVSGLDAGIYLVTLKDETGIHQRRLVKY